MTGNNLSVDQADNARVFDLVVVVGSARICISDSLSKSRLDQHTGADDQAHSRRKLMLFSSRRARTSLRGQSRGYGGDKHLLQVNDSVQTAWQASSRVASLHDGRPLTGLNRRKHWSSVQGLYLEKLVTGGSWKDGHIGLEETGARRQASPLTSPWSPFNQCPVDDVGRAVMIADCSSREWPSQLGA
ncbi:hypothetical protein RRG08_043497 [Elysia crispata]|uniref:Uncharacterized protein n=1 Tax=Elysia crispata TaxID=231223 RepID=A0AAE0YFK7_9GAST|nr:hypothetical protein RRG08_043497 [Elysia crispata]